VALACSSAGDAGGNSAASPIVAGCPVLPANNPWNQPVSDLPVHPNSDLYIDTMGRTGTIHPDFGTSRQGALGIPYTVVDGSQPPVRIQFVRSESQSDPGPYPIPLNAPIEGGPAADGDRHVLAIDSSACMLYELYAAYPMSDHWQAGSGAVWNLRSNHSRPVGFTSADAAGLPIFPGLVRYDEVVENKRILHALRFTAANTQAGYIPPASHYASTSYNQSYPPMGLRFRMKASYDCGSYSPEVQVICAALKRYGMLLADNGKNWHVTGAPDERWDDSALSDLLKISGDAFEAVNTGAIQTY
jgi:hypothetical protein